MDYGVDGHHIYLVMPQYPCNLREWRLQQTGPPAAHLQTYLAVLADVIRTMQAGPHATS